MGASLDTANRGVSALSASMALIIRGVRSDARITLIVSSSNSLPQSIDLPGESIGMQVVNHRVSMRSGWRKNLIAAFLLACLWRVMPFRSISARILASVPLLEKIHNSDLVGNIHGGDSFSDIYGTWRFIQGAIPDLIVLLLRKRLVLMPQTYGPYNGVVARQVSGMILKRAAFILSRDREGIGVVESILGHGESARKVAFCPDVAFTMPSCLPDEMDIHPPLERETGYSLIGLNVSGLMFNGGYTRSNMFGLRYDYREFVRELLTRLLRETDAEILLVPHTFGKRGNVNSDPDACESVFLSVKEQDAGRVHILRGEYDQFRIKGIIGQCDFFVGSRMHACIAALSQGIPTMGVAYSRKFRGVFDSVEMGDYAMDARELDVETTVARIVESYWSREEIRRRIQSSVGLAQDVVKSVFRNVFQGRRSEESDDAALALAGRQR